MLTKWKFSKGHNRIDWNSLRLSTLKLNLSIFPSKYRSIVLLFMWPSYTSNVRTRVSKEGTTVIISGKYASKDDWFQFILTFVYYYMRLAMRKAAFGAYRFYPKYSDTWSPYHICPKISRKKKVREKFRECHNHKQQPFPDPKRKRKPTNLNKHKPNKRTKITKISSLFPKRCNRNTKRTEKHKNKMTHGKTYNKSPRKPQSNKE